MDFFRVPLDPFSSAESVTFSSAVNVGMRLKFWKINPKCWLRNSASSSSLSFVIFWPLMIMFPSVGSSNPAMRLRRVVLPLPEAPVMATNCPVGITRSMPLRMFTLCPPPKRDLLSPLI